MSRPTIIITSNILTLPLYVTKPRQWLSTTRLRDKRFHHKLTCSPCYISQMGFLLASYQARIVIFSWNLIKFKMIFCNYAFSPNRCDTRIQNG